MMDNDKFESICEGILVILILVLLLLVTFVIFAFAEIPAYG